MGDGNPCTPGDAPSPECAMKHNTLKVLAGLALVLLLAAPFLFGGPQWLLTSIRAMVRASVSTTSR